MPIDHTSLPVRDLDASLKFYLAALKPLNYSLFMHLEKENVVGLQAKYHGPDFWLTKAGKEKENNTIIHIAFKGRSRKDVHSFHEAALKAGATCNGPPGERPQYTKGYYAAYVLDPDGNNIECVYYQPWWLSAIQIAPMVVGGVVVGGLGWWGGRAGWGL